MKFHEILIGENDGILISWFITHTIHVWYIYPHLVDFYGINVGKYTSSSHGSVIHI